MYPMPALACVTRQFLHLHVKKRENGWDVRQKWYGAHHNLCAVASGRLQLKKKTPTRPSIQQLQGGMSSMGLQDSTSR